MAGVYVNEMSGNNIQMLKVTFSYIYFILFLYMAINRDSVKPFATKEFNKNWPFCEDLAKDLFQKSLQFDSLKDFFYYLLPFDIEIDLIDNETDCRYEFYDGSFFIEKEILYYYKSDNDTIYTLDHILYDTIVCEAVRYYVKDSLKKNTDQNVLWERLFKYLLYNNFSVLNVLLEEKFVEKMKLTIIRNFYYGFRLEENVRRRKASWAKITTGSTYFIYTIRFSKEMLLNILLYCDFPRRDSDLLVADFFREKNYQNILLYYQNVLSDRFQITVD